MDVIELLKDDHGRILRLLKKIGKMQSALERRATFELVARDLRNHAMVEEKILYPALKEAWDFVGAAHETHLIAARLVREMEAMSPADDLWGAKLKVLGDILAHHMKEERETIFPKIKEILGRQECDRIGTRIEALAYVAAVDSPSCSRPPTSDNF